MGLCVQCLFLYAQAMSALIPYLLHLRSRLQGVAPPPPDMYSIGPLGRTRPPPPPPQASAASAGGTTAASNPALALSSVAGDEDGLAPALLSFAAFLAAPQNAPPASPSSGASASAAGGHGGRDSLDWNLSRDRAGRSNAAATVMVDGTAFDSTQANDMLCLTDTMLLRAYVVR